MHALLVKYIENRCTPQELNQVLAYLQTSEGQQQLEKLMDREIYSDQAEITEADINTDYQQIFERITSATHQTAPQSHRFRIPRYQQYAAAAVFAGLALFTSLWFLMLSPNDTLYQTAYGETQSVVLPDGSAVTLNGNSRLSVKNNFEEEREVWLEGEAFFEVAKNKDPMHDKYIKFVVHTSKLDVEVLGTTFNVSDRQDQTQVVLTEGKVHLLTHKGSAVQMKPGERFYIQEDKQILESNLEDINQWSSWKNQQIIFKNQRLKDIARQLQHTYGYQIDFPSESIANEKFTVQIQHQDIELLFSLIARSFQLTYTQEGKIIKYEK